jgi:hypothetical protein
MEQFKISKGLARNLVLYIGHGILLRFLNAESLFEWDLTINAYSIFLMKKLENRKVS